MEEGKQMNDNIKNTVNYFKGSSIAASILLIGSLYLGQRFGFEWWNYVMIIIGFIEIWGDQ
jgi:magnesium-transporting ATPase (P-type)